MTAPVMPPIVTEEETSFASDLLTDDQEADYPDNFRVSWGSFVVAGVGFMVDQYNLFVIGTVILAMSVTPDVGPYTQTEGAVTRAIKLLGAMFGQLTFGWVADALGRRVACLLTLMLVLVGALGSSLSAPVLGISIYWCLSVWQLVLGVGVGGEYPLSASMSRESTSDLRTVGLTFCMQGFGFILGPIVVLVLLYLFPSNTSEDLNIVWRGALGFSAIPAALLLYPRYTMHNSSSYDKARITDRYKKPLLQQLGRTSRRRLLGTAGCWFLFDVSFYGNSILATQAFAAMRLTADGNPQSPHDQIASAAWSLLAVALLGLPGYLVALSSLPHMGLRAMQVTGMQSFSESRTRRGLKKNDRKENDRLDTPLHLL
ncbi:hypothetical protein DIPPA_62771 [Diplonema papillatum]|nr:hypothetical protein DIPPA_62771 [Diplonema papillatum]